MPSNQDQTYRTEVLDAKVFTSLPQVRAITTGHVST
jgi:hypothetical protein